MSSRDGERPAVVRSLGIALACLGVGFALFAAVEVMMLAFDQALPLWQIVFPPAAGVVYAGAGLIAWWRRPSNRLAAILVGGGVVWLITGLASVTPTALVVIAIVTATVPLSVVVHLLLAFPSGRLRSPLARWTVLAGYGVSLVLQIPLYALDPGGSPDGVLSVVDRPDLAGLALTVQKVAGMAVMAVTTWILIMRIRSAAGTHRRVLGTLYTYGVVVVLLTPLVSNLSQVPGVSSGVVSDIQVALLTVVPVAFVAAILRGGYARTGELAELSAWLGAGAAGQASLTSSLARALGDSSARVLYWMPDAGVHVAEDGSVAELPQGGVGRGSAPVEFGGRRIGAIVYDESLVDDVLVVSQVARVIAIAVEQRRLEVELRANQLQLRMSRVRILQAANQERQRIAQDLHDGLQADLVLLALEAQQLAAQPGTPGPTAAAAVVLRGHIDQAAADLRSLVRSVMPAPLVERGLAEATEDLVDRIPVPTCLEFDVPDRLPALVSNTAYFILAEALGNAVKHAEASALTVRLAREGETLSLEVSDNGVGGAHPNGGMGLRGLADRVDALGGRLRLESPKGQGTRVLVELPCES